METPLENTLLSIQEALCNSVTPQLRAVSLSIDKENFEFLPFFYYDGILTDELIELTGVVLAETDTFTGEVYFCRDSILRLDYPEKIPVKGTFAFLRYEPDLPEFKKKNRNFLRNEFVPFAIFRLDMQEALLGKVTPALRNVSVGMNSEEKKLIAHFIYDGEISDRDFTLASAAIRESGCSFPDHEIESHIERVDFPNEMFPLGERLAYWRQEVKWDKQHH